MHDIDYQLQHMLQGRFSEGWAISEKLERQGIHQIVVPEGKTKEEMWLRHNFNRGWFLLQQGDYQQGCQLLESGRHLNVYGGARLATSAPLYNPGMHSLKGKSIIISLEGGYGDEIIHSRFAQSYKELGAEKVYLAAAPELGSILSRVPGVDRVILRNESHTVPHDYWVPGFSAGWLAGHTYKTLPGKPYLQANPKSVEVWRSIVSSEKKKIGIRWAGNPKFEHQQFRRFPPQYLLDLAKYEDIQLYSFQRDDNTLDLPDNVVDLQHLLISWDDTLAALSNLDLVITSCTSIAHASAALGIETWVLTPILPYHTWTLSAPYSTTSPFYSCVRLFRQETPNLWHSTFIKLRTAIEQKFNMVPQVCQNYCEQGTVHNISDEFKAAANYSDYLAKVLFDVGKYRDSINQNNITLSLIGTDHPLVHKNIAQCYYRLSEVNNALRHFKRYLEITGSTDVIDRRQLAQYLTRLGRFEEGLLVVLGQQASPEKWLDLGWFAHRDGDFKTAMRLTELGRGDAAWINTKQPPCEKRWRGEDLRGKRLCVVGEAGMGDEIIFSRWLPLLKDLAAEVSYYTDNTLVDVFERNFGITRLSGTYDYWVPSMSLPFLLGVETPGSAPYLKPCPTYVEKWKGRLPINFTAICWSGDKNHAENEYRSIPADYISKIYQGTLVGVTLGSNNCPDNVLDVSKDIHTWEDTLAILSLAEKVITMSSSVSVAAGAIGAQTHVFTNVVDYFTWCGSASGTQSKWFNSVCVWRQKRFGEWESIIEEALKE